MTHVEIATACKGCMPLVEAVIGSIRSTIASFLWTSEFAGLEKLQEEIQNDVDAYSLKTAQESIELNRYLDVLPYDHNRVKLNRRPQKRGIQGSYINASWVECSPVTTLLNDGRDESGVLKDLGRLGTGWKYVVAQGPLFHTCGDFWKMICDNDIGLIVMLTGFVENGKVKCAKYFAEDVGHMVTFGKHSVLTVSVKTLSAGVVSRMLHVKKKSPGSGQSLRQVHHVHLTDWPDHGVPTSSSSLLEVCAQARAYRRASGSSAETSVAVHCSAGIGRSGVFCAVDSVLQSLLALCESRLQGTSLSNAMAICERMNLVPIVAHLRRQRGGMVHTADQYAFCYAALLTILEKVVQEQEPEQDQEQDC